MPEKPCKRCGDTKPFERFPPDKHMKSGRRNVCYDCVNAARTPEQKAMARQRARKWARAHPEAQRANIMLWRERHRERYQEYQRLYHRTWSRRNADKVAGYKARRRALDRA